MAAREAFQACLMRPSAADKLDKNLPGGLLNRIGVRVWHRASLLILWAIRCKLV
jgi:hypothetical protein